MKDMIIDLKKAGKTVILCSHLLADVQDVCDRIAILHQGELKELGRVSELLSIQDEFEIRTKNLSEDAKSRIREIVRESGADLLKAGHPSTTLEDLFVRIVRTSEAHPGRRYLPERSNVVAGSENSAKP
jgi:ABC-2 type transport system ATP-binding protein